MNRRQLLASLAILAAASTSGCRGRGLIQPVRDATVVENPAVVTLVGWSSPSKGGGGTGFLLAPDKLVTCRHVLAGMTSVSFRLGDGRQAPVRGVWADVPEHDLLLLAIDALDGIQPLVLADAEPRAGDVLTAVGSPDLRAQTVTRVRVEGNESTSTRFGHVFHIRGALGPGASGCPLFDDQGRVVGVAAQGGGQVEDRFGAIPARFVRALAAGRFEAIADWGARTAVEPEVRIQNDYDDATHAYRRKEFGKTLGACERLLPRVMDRPVYAGGTCDLLASSLVALGRTDEAIARIRALVAANPNQAWRPRCLGDLAGHLGRYADAVPSLLDASRLDPGDAGTHARAALALYRLHRHVEAEREARAALAASPQDGDAQFLVGTTILAQGRASEAVPFLEVALRATPESASANTNLGWAYAGTGRTTEAIPLLEKAIRLAPRVAVVRGYLVRVRLQAGDPAAAARENEALRAIDPELAAELDPMVTRRGPAPSVAPR